MPTTTAYTVTTIEVGTASPDLAALAGRSYDSQYTALPNANLPRVMRQNLDKVFLAMTGEDLPLEENTFLIKAEDGIYNRLFGPVLKAGSSDVEGTSDGSLYIQWGPRYIPVSLTKEGMTVTVNDQPITLEVEFSEFNFSGRGGDVALMVSVDEENDSGQVILPVAVRFTDYKNVPEVKVLNGMLKKKSEELIPLVQQVTPKGSGTFRSRADNDIDFKDLEVDVAYEVISYRPVNTTYGQTFRMMLRDYPVSGQTAECWCHSTLRPIFATQPEITEEKPAILTIKDKQTTPDGKTRIRCALILSRQEEIDENDLNLAF
jgi:hypothetical protein